MTAARDDWSSWIVGALMGLLAILGLLLASRAEERAFEWFGLLVFACAVLVIFALIRRATAPGDGAGPDTGG